MIKDVIKIVLVAIVYFMAARFGLGIDAVGGFATLVWPPTGIAIASILIFGYKLWPAILIGAFAANFANGAPILVAFGIGVGNMLEALLGAYFLELVGFRSHFGKLKSVLGLIFLTAMIATIVSATIGVSSLIIGGIVGASDFLKTWIAWWVGDMLGALVIVPLIITWRRLPFKYLNPKALAETLIIFSILVLINFGVFINLLGFNFNISAVTYLVFPPLAWAAIRFGQYGATLGILLTSIIAIAGTVNNLGPFAGTNVSESLIQLQSFLAIAITTALILGAIISEREEAEHEIKKLNEELEGEVHDKTKALLEAQTISHVGSWEWDIPKNQVSWSAELYKIYGLEKEDFKATYEGFLERVHSDDRSMVKRIIEEAYKLKKPFEFYHRIVRPDGEVRTLRARGAVITDNKGNLLKMSGTGQDVTEERAALTNLKIKTEELEKLNQFMVDREVRMAELKKNLEEIEKKKS